MDVYTKNSRIYVPKILRHDVLTWYHHYLCHPGATRLEKTIAATMTWPGRPTDSRAFVKVCARMSAREEVYAKIWEATGETRGSHPMGLRMRGPRRSMDGNHRQKIRQNTRAEGDNLQRSGHWLVRTRLRGR